MVQAEMKFEGYLPVPGHCSYRNVNTIGSVLPFNNVDNIFKNVNYCNGALLLPPLDQHSLQNKEAVKQTILKHEAIFKDQIGKLHCIYWRQRELMDEMKKHKLLNHHVVQQGTVQSNPLSPQDLCDYAQKTSQVLSSSRVNPACNRSSVSAAKNDLSLSHSNGRRSAHSSPDPVQTEFSLKGHELENSKKFGKQILDLELPPIEYIDNEDEESLQNVREVSGDPLKRISEAVHKSDWQPYHDSGACCSVFQEDYLNPGSVSFKKNLLADLNKPIKLEEKSGTMSICLPDLNEPNKTDEEVAAASKFLVDLNEPIELQEEAELSSDFQSPLAGHAEFSCQDLPQKSNSVFQFSPTDITHNIIIGRDSQACSTDSHLEKYDDEAEQSRRDATSLSPGLSDEVSISLQNIDLEQAHEHETSHLMNQWKRKSSGEGLESHGKDHSSNSNSVPVSTNNVGTSSQLISLTDVGRFKPSSVLSSKKQMRDIVRTPIIVHALPCFSSSLRLRKRSESSIIGPGVYGKRSCHGKSLKFSPNFDNSSFHQSSFCKGSSAESKILESIPPSIGSTGQDVSEEMDLAFEHHDPTKPEGSVRVLPWLKTKTVRKRKRSKRSESSTQVETHQNPSEDDAIKNNANDRVISINGDHDPLSDSEEPVTSHKLVAGGGLDNKLSSFGAGIVLNTEDDEFSPITSLSTELGLEEPESPENKESSPPRRDSDENQVETPSELSGKEDGDVQEDLARYVVEAIVSGEEDWDLQEEHSRNAATALVSISSSVVQSCLEKAACEPSEPSRSDELHWFAKVVSLVVDDPDSEFRVVLSSKNSDDYEECMFNGLDYFEAMTLNLIETKVEEEDRFKTSEKKGKKEEESGVAYMPSQQRRGRMRRARQQRKDFQSEILPSLVSLSRYEVTEDLQRIEGLIEAAGSQRGTFCTRSMSRNARAGGRKRSCISTSNLTDITIWSPSKQHSSFRGKDTEESRVVGWGDGTRRRRGPRSHTTNPWLR